MLTRLFNPLIRAESTSVVDSISVSLADSAADEVKRDWRSKRTTTSKAPVEDASAVTDANNVMNVERVIAALEHVNNLWKTRTGTQGA
jgi:hypothetical protein